MLACMPDKKNNVHISELLSIKSGVGSVEIRLDLNSNQSFRCLT